MGLILELGAVVLFVLIIVAALDIMKVRKHEKTRQENKKK